MRRIDADVTRDPWFFLDVEMHSSARSQRRNAAPFLYSSAVKLARAFERTAGLRGAAKTSFVKKCKQDSWESKAVSKKGKAASRRGQK